MYGGTLGKSGERIPVLFQSAHIFQLMLINLFLYSYSKRHWTLLVCSVSSTSTIPTCGKSGVLIFRTAFWISLWTLLSPVLSFSQLKIKSFVWACDILAWLGKSTGFPNSCGCVSRLWFSLSQQVGCNSPWQCWLSVLQWSGSSFTWSDSPWPPWHCFHRFAVKKFYILQNRVISYNWHWCGFCHGLLEGKTAPIDPP